MSKCDIRILFDRTDRTYFGGETVTGRVYIRMNEAVKASGITLTHQWKTHGRGNKAEGPKEVVQLAQANTFTAGHELDVPFSLVTETHPLTYHGTLINIDHYVMVQVDVPWAFNPKLEEEYILKAGRPPEGFSGSRSSVISLAPKSGVSSAAGKVLLTIVVVILLVIVSVFALFLLPIILIVAGIIWARRKAVASRLGEVQLSIPHVVVAPGEAWPVRLQFQPKKQFPINGITVTLRGRESATSGSGTKATTHTHNVLEHKTLIRQNELLTAGVPVDENLSIPFPQTDAFSFEATSNKIEWTAEVRIDIPKFPDWAKSQPLKVVPIEFLTDVADAPAIETGDGISSSRIAPSASLAPPPLPDDMESDRWDQGDVETSEDNGDSTDFAPQPAPQSLTELVERLSAVGRHGHERADLVASVAGTVFDATVVVDRVGTTMGTMMPDPQYENGKTVTGTIEGTNQSIQILSTESLNDDVDDLRRGALWDVQISVTGWDSLYNRINALQIES